MADSYLEIRRKQRALYEQMIAARQSYIPQWRDLADYVLPDEARFLITDTAPGQGRMQKILDPTASMAAGTLSAGMMSSITNPAVPWFVFTAPDPDMMEYQPVKIWLSQVEAIIRNIFLKSNLYKVLPSLYENCAVFGTACMSMLEHDRDVLRFRQFPIGSYCLALNEDQRVDTFSTEFTWTVRQVVERFGEENVSTQVSVDYKRGQTERAVGIFHIIKPNEQYEPDQIQSKYKKFSSCYYEIDCTEKDKALLEEGFDEFPIISPRWHAPAGRIYGAGPGRKSLPHVKELQTMQRRKSQAVEKMVNPAMVGPSSMNGQRASTLAGDITYVDERQGQGTFRPAYQMDPRVDQLQLDIEDRRRGIDSAYFKDLFLMFANSDRREITAEEIIRRNEEKITVLSPVLGTFDEELLKLIVDRGFGIAARKDMLPPAPPELQGQELKVEYISLMHKAQKLASLGPIERVLSYAERMIPLYPQILDKIDLDQTIDEAADILGAPPKMIRSDEAVAAIRQQRAQAQQQQAQQAALESASKTAKNLAQSPMDGDNALSRLTQAT